MAAMRTKGAPRKATSKGTLLSLPRHWTQGSLANVVIPEKIESAVTSKRQRRNTCALWRRETYPRCHQGSKPPGRGT